MPIPVTPPRNHIRLALRTIRKACGLSQEAFALISSRTYVSTLERGLKSPTLNKIDELAEVMQIHPLTLLVLAYAEPGHPDECQKLMNQVTSELSRLTITD